MGSKYSNLLDSVTFSIVHTCALCNSDKPKDDRVAKITLYWVTQGEHFHKFKIVQIYFTRHSKINTVTPNSLHKKKFSTILKGFFSFLSLIF